jgi:hypothetical protein
MRPVFAWTPVIQGVQSWLQLFFQPREGESDASSDLPTGRKNTIYVRGGPSGPVFSFLFILNFNQANGLRFDKKNLHQ